MAAGANKPAGRVSGFVTTANSASTSLINQSAHHVARDCADVAVENITSAATRGFFITTKRASDDKSNGQR